jgi:hypothetical protein
MDNVSIHVNDTTFIDPGVIYMNSSTLSSYIMSFLTFLEARVYGLGGGWRRSRLEPTIFTHAGVTITDVDVRVSQSVSLLLSNYWLPGWMRLNGSATYELDGLFLLYSDTLRSYTEPEPFAKIPVIISDTSLTLSLSSTAQSGGYDFEVFQRNNGREMWVQLTSFNPTARVSDTGNYIIVKFPRETNTPLHNSNCTGLFDSATIAKFNPSDLKCTWTRADELQIFSSKLFFSEPLQFLPRVVGDVKNSSFSMNETLNIMVSSPTSPPFPFPVVNVRYVN